MPSWGNTHLCHRQALPKVDGGRSVGLGDTVRDSLLEAAEGKDIHSRDKEEDDGALEVKDYGRRLCRPDRGGSHRTLRECMHGWRFREIAVSGGAEARERKKPGIEQKAKQGHMKRGHRRKNYRNPKNCKGQRPAHEILGNNCKAEM